MRKTLFIVQVAVAMALLILGFILPPLGVIDNSVLIAVGIIGLIAVVPYIPSYIDSIRLSKDQVYIDLQDDKKLLEDLDKALKLENQRRDNKKLLEDLDKLLKNKNN